MPDNLPSDEIQQPSAERKSSGWAVRHRWFVLGTMLFAQTAFAAVFNPLSEWRDLGFRFYFLSGFILTQPLLYAIWAVFAPQRYYVRFLWAFFLGIVAMFAIELGELKGEGWLLGALSVYHLAFFFATIGILSVVQCLYDWKFRSVGEDETADGYLAHQFGIKHLILLTTIIALALSLFQSLAVICPNYNLPNLLTGWELCGTCIEIVAMLLPTAFIPWLILARYRRWWISLPISVALFCAFEAAAYTIVSMMELHTEMRGIILAVQAGAALSLSIAALTLRWCGYELERVRKNSQGG